MISAYCGPTAVAIDLPANRRLTGRRLRATALGAPSGQESRLDGIVSSAGQRPPPPGQPAAPRGGGHRCARPGRARGLRRGRVQARARRDGDELHADAAVFPRPCRRPARRRRTAGGHAAAAVPRAVPREAVETAIAAATGHPVRREQVVEVGNLAGANCRAAMRMVALLRLPCCRATTDGSCSPPPAPCAGSSRVSARRSWSWPAPTARASQAARIAGAATTRRSARARRLPAHEPAHPGLQLRRS